MIRVSGRPALLLLALVPAPVMGQAARNGLAVAPYLGVQVPRKTLLVRPTSTDPERDREKAGFSFTAGARVSVGLLPRLDLEGDVGVASGKLILSSVNIGSGTDVRTLLLSGRLAYWLALPSEPFGASVHLGVAATRHSFERALGGASDLQDKTHLGGVVGATAVFRVGSGLAVTFGAESSLYSASFEVVPLGGGPAGTTASRTQHDVRVLLGLRVPLVGQ